MFLLLAFLCTTLCSTVASHRLSTNDDIALIRQRVLEMVVWPTNTSIPGVVQTAMRYLEHMNSSCYWEDIDYTDKTLAIWLTIEHLARVNTMIQAITVPGSPVHDDAHLIIGAHCALDVWLVRDWSNPNWWYNQIGVPLLVTGQLLMLGDNATYFETQKITQISFRSDWWEHDPGTGANLVWMIQIQLYRSLATNNRTGIDQGLQRMWKDIAVLPLGGQGIQSDWSYHFHGTQLLSGSYGQDWSEAMFIFILCTVNTSYELNQEQLLVFVNFLIQGDAWMIIDNRWDWQVIGRAIDRAGTTLITDFQPPWIRSLAELVTVEALKQDLLDFANRLDCKPYAHALIGNKHFYTSDYQVHRRSNWIATIKMQSVRTQPTECINFENQKGEYLGQGVLNIYTNNAAAYQEIFPLLDWQSINGITVEHDIPIESCRRGAFDWVDLDFVGGVCDDAYGLAVMDTATHNLTAKRSWHFYDDAIVALASNLTLTTQNSAWTTLASRLVSKGIITVGFFNGTRIILSDGINYSFPYITTDVSKNVQWIHMSEANIGYLLQTQGLYARLGAEISTKTASYSTIGPYNHTVTGRTATIWLDHGFGPYKRDYSYMILPNVDVESIPILIEQLDANHVFSCISNSDFLHGIAWSTLQRASFVLWNDMTTAFSCESSLFTIRAQLNDAGAYLYQETSTDFSVTVSHPTRINGTIKLNIDKIGYGQGCMALTNNTTNVIIPLPSTHQLLGTSTTVTCKKRQKKTLAQTIMHY